MKHPAGGDRRALSEIGEFGLIREIASRAARPGRGVVTGIGDDCAVIRPGRDRLLLWTVDLLLSGRHFEPGVEPFQAGWKALAVSLSDIAAMGGRPLYALVFLALPPDATLGYAREIFRGVSELADRFGVRVIGGDTNRDSRLTIGTTVLGEVEKKYLVGRAGARPGDLVCLTGPLGGGPSRHLSFLPRVEEGAKIARQLRPTAMIDISDGLLGDLGRITEESGTGALLRLPDIPCLPGVTPGEALASGEEFELLFTIGPRKKAAVTRLGFCVAGEITPAGSGLRVLRGDGGEYRPGKTGFDHFAPRGADKEGQK